MVLCRVGHKVGVTGKVTAASKREYQHRWLETGRNAEVQNHIAADLYG